MSRKNKKKSNQSKPKQNTKTEQPICATVKQYSAEEMRHIIAEAILEAENTKKQQEEEQRKKEHEEWRAAIGGKDYSKEDVSFKSLRQGMNDFMVFLKLSFGNKEHIKDDRAIVSLTKSMLSGVFTLVKWVLNVATLACIVVVMLRLFTDSMQSFPAYGLLLIVAFAFITFMLSRFFRMASIEVDNIKDRTYLFTLFAAVTTIISIILTIVGFFIKQE